MRFAFVTILAAGAGRVLLFAQSPSFEVASVKPSSPQERNIGMLAYPGGRLRVTNYTLHNLIHEAYRVQDFQIVGGPKWAGEDRYSIDAKPPAGSAVSKISPANPKLPPPEEELLMLQTLLAERFHLTVHEETREGPVFNLMVGSQGAKLGAATDQNAFPVVVYGRTGIAERPDFMQGITASMPLFCKRLSDFLGRPVIDKTGLAGAFDFKFEYVNGIDDDAAGPSLSTAIQQLGLKLMPAKGQILQIVIDHAEKPTEN